MSARRARHFTALAGALVLVVLPVWSEAAEKNVRIVKRDVTPEEEQAFGLFLNVKDDFVVRCIYRPDERKVAVDALQKLALELGPAFAAHFPASFGKTFPEVWSVYQKTLIELKDTPELKDRTLQQLVEQSLRAFCYSLDRYSDYDDQETLAREKLVKKEDYIGVGMTIERTPEGYDCYPFPGEPADLAGCLAGDRLIEVDGKSVRGVTRLNVGLMIFGKEGDTVNLKVRHSGDTKESVISVKRAPIRTSPIEVATGAEGATVRLRRLEEGTLRDLRTFLRTLRPNQNLTLDLRGCPGGSFTVAVAIAELFLPQGSPICTVETRIGKEVFTSKNPSPYRPSSLVILQNKATMSGAELITVALVTSPKLHAQSQGERTYGKGVTLGVFEVKDGGRLRFADGRMYGPNGEFWDGEGLNPTTEDLRPK